MCKKKQFERKLGELIDYGNMLLMAMQNDCDPDAFAEQFVKIDDEKKLKIFLKKLPDFKSEYQKWYSEAQAVVRQVLPDRLDDFVSYYEYPRIRKDITSQNYMIKDYLQGLIIRRGGQRIAEPNAAIPEFQQQVNILVAAKETLESTLIDMSAILQADLFDSENESARALAKSGHFRAAGVICGVVIEKHLRQICQNRGFPVKKNNPGISDFNQLLRDGDAISVPQWRFIQHLADIRNICGHAKDKEPSKDEIEDLLNGTDKVLKTVF